MYPTDKSMSPNKLLIYKPICWASAAHMPFSPPNPDVSCNARFNFNSHVLICARKFCFCKLASSNLSLSALHCFSMSSSRDRFLFSSFYASSSALLARARSSLSGKMAWNTKWNL